MDNGADGTSELTVDSAASLLEGLDLETETVAEEPQKKPAAAPVEDTDDEEPETDESPDDDAEATEEEPAPDADSEPEDEDTESADESPDAEEEPPAPKTWKVKVDGAELEVPEDELLKGYSRTADYTRKTQQLAEARKQFEETEVASVRAERARYAESLEQLTAIIDQAQGTAEPDWNTLRKDLSPAEYAAAVADWTLARERREKIEAELVETRRKMHDDEMAQVRAFVQAEQEKLVQALPEMATPDGKSKVMQELRGYAQGLGFSTDDLSNVRDHRIVLMLRKAMLYDRAQEKAKAGPAKTPQPTKPNPAPKAKPTPTLKPGPAATPAAKKNTRTTELKRSLRATGSDKDAAALIEDLLDDE